AAYVGAGGLGRWVFAGIRQSYPTLALAGALLISCLALVADLALAALGQALRHRLGQVEAAEPKAPHRRVWRLARRSETA
ncbi:MAG: hypothetical protein KGR26_16965, partial [Cyanobacteria bacterium REEB65]|nr:hypothetical protein [Cyanobacteria bacterium REEB65]